MGSNCKPCKTVSPNPSQQLTLNLSYNPHNIQYFCQEVQNLITNIRKKYNNQFRNSQQYILPNDKFYRGIRNKNIKEGYGEYYHKNIVFFGLFINDKPEGQMLIVSGLKDYMKAFFLNGKIQGKALEKIGQAYFNGVYQNGEKKKGKLTTFQYIYEGEFKNNKFDGYGTLFYEHGDKYQGSFKNGQYNGHGVYLSHENTQYRGQFEDGLYHGMGCFKWGDKCYYLGEYRKGQRNGYGKLIQDQKQYRGVWMNGELIKQSEQKQNWEKMITKQSEEISPKKSEGEGMFIKLF